MASSQAKSRWFRSTAFRATWAVLFAIFGAMFVAVSATAVQQWPRVEPVVALLTAAIVVALYVRVWRTGVEVRGHTLVIHGFFVTRVWNYRQISSFFVDNYYCKLQPVEGSPQLVIPLQSSPFWTRNALDRTVAELNNVVAERKGEVAIPLPPPTRRRMDVSTVAAIALAALAGGHHR